MASNKVFRFGPVAVPSVVGNLLNPATTTGGTNGGSSAQYIVLRHIRIVNKTGSAVTFSGYIGATGASAAGTEFLGNALSVAAQSFVDWYGAVRLDAADFLTGIASTTLALVISGEGEIGVSG